MDRVINRPKLIDKYITLSNLLTLSRIIATPFVVGALRSGYYKSAFFLFTLAMLTDLLDGYFARLLGEPTLLGTYLDPLADKILLLSCFFTLFHIQFPTLVFPAWFLIGVLGREVVILCGGFFLYIYAPGHIATPTKTGKCTIAGYSLVIGWVLIAHVFGWEPYKTFTCALFILTGLSLVSVAQYIRRGITWLTDSKK